MLLDPKQVDEITVAWAAVELWALLPRLAATKSVTAPLRGGPLSRRLTLKQCTQLAAQQAAQQGIKVRWGSQGATCHSFIHFTASTETKGSVGASRSQRTYPNYSRLLLK